MTSVLDLSARLNAAMNRPPVIPAPAPGVYENVPSATYHAWDAVSSSRLGWLRRSPAHLMAYIAQPPEDTAAQVIGRAVHTAILEPEQFASTFAVAEQCSAIKKDNDRCTNTGTLYHLKRGWVCGIPAHCRGAADEFDASRVSISPEQWATCVGTRAAAYAHMSASLLLNEPGRAELSVVWIDSETGLTCKARLDRHIPDLGPGIVADLKSTENASPRAFARSIDDYGYHIQAAHYLTGAQAAGLRAGSFVHIAFEKKPPYAVATYRIIREVLDVGDSFVRPLMRLYAKCRASNEWPAYSQQLQDIALPDYAWKKADDEIALIEPTKAGDVFASAGTNYEVTP